MNDNKTIKNFPRLKIFFRGIGVVFLSLVFAALGYWAIVYWGFPKFTQGEPGTMRWDLFDVFTGVASLTVFAGGIAFAIPEYFRKEKAHEDKEKEIEEKEIAKKKAEAITMAYDVFVDLFQKLTAPEQEAALRWLLSNIDIKRDDEDIESWYTRTHATIMKRASRSKTIPEGQKALKMTLNCFDYIGFVSRYYIFLDKDTIDWISAPVAKVWRRIGPYVEHVRTLRNTTDYYLAAEYIGKLSIDYRKSKGMDDEEIATNTP